MDLGEHTLFNLFQNSNFNYEAHLHSSIYFGIIILKITSNKSLQRKLSINISHKQHIYRHLFYMISAIVDITYIYVNKLRFDRILTKIGDGGIMVSESISVVGSDTELDTVATLKLVFTVGSDIESLSNKLPLFAIEITF